ncbi:MAG: hypothetical protein HQ567_16095 [Candidatus Nealsonbacteria bacterium]|nr:hypothetical protein [Candidatus Nealsonbacteria bacterium]
MCSESSSPALPGQSIIGEVVNNALAVFMLFGVTGHAREDVGMTLEIPGQIERRRDS